MESRANFEANESLPEVACGEEISNKRAIEDREPIDTDDDEIEIDFEAYGHMNETLSSEPHFEYVFKTEPEVDPKVEPVVPIVIEASEKFVICVSAHGVFTFEKIKKDSEENNEHLPIGNNNEESSLLFETETEEAAEIISEEGGLNLSAETLKQGAQEKFGRNVEPSPNKSDKLPGKRLKSILKKVQFNLSTNTVKQGAREKPVELSSNESDETGRCANTTLENEKLSLSTEMLTQGQQRENEIPAKHVKHCWSEFEKILGIRAVVALERCALSTSCVSPTKICKTNRVTNPSEKRFSPKTNTECQKMLAKDHKNSVNGRSEASFSSKVEKRIVESRKKSVEAKFAQRKPIDPERLRRLRAFQKKVTAEKKLRNLRRTKRNEMAKQRQKSSLSVRRAVMRLRERRNFPSSSGASKNRNCKSNDKKVERDEHFSPGTNKENQEKFRDESRNLRPSRRNETAYRLAESSLSDDDERRIVTRLRKPSSFGISEKNVSLVVEIRKENQEKFRTEVRNLRRSERNETAQKLNDERRIVERLRRPRTIPSSSGTEKIDDENNCSVVSECEKHLLSKPGKEKETRNLRKSRRINIAQPREKNASSDEDERRLARNEPLVAERQKSLRSSSWSGATIRINYCCKTDSETDNGDIHSFEVSNAAHYSSDVSKESQEKVMKLPEKPKVTAEATSLSRIGSNEICKRLEVRCLSDVERRIARRREDAVERTRRSRAKETSEEREQRLQAEAERTRRNRAKETPEEREQRLQANAERRRKKRANETPQQRADRRAARRSTNRKWKEKESPEELAKSIADRSSPFEKCVDDETPEQFELLNKDDKLLDDDNGSKHCDIVLSANKDSLDDECRSRDDAVEKRLTPIKEINGESCRIRREKRKKINAKHVTKLKTNETAEEREKRNAHKKLRRKRLKEKELPKEITAKRLTRKRRKEKEKLTEREKSIGGDDNALNGGAIAIEDDKCNSSDDEGKIARKMANVVQIKLRALPSSSEISKKNSCRKDVEANDNNVSLAVECEEHFLSEINKESPEKLTKTPEEYEISVRNLELFTTNDASKLDDSKIDDGNNGAFVSNSSPETSEEAQEKPPTVLEMFELSLSDDARRECSSDDEYCSSDDQVKRRRTPRATLSSVSETPTNILNEHSYSLQKREVHFPPETESVKQKDVTETREQFEECRLSVGEGIVVETRTSLHAFPSVSETQTFDTFDEEHCYSLDKRKIYTTPESTEIEPLRTITETIIDQRDNSSPSDELDKRKIYTTPESTEIEPLQKITEAIDQPDNSSPSDEVRRSRMKRAKQTPEQRARRQARGAKSFKNRLATETTEARERRLALKRSADKRRKAKETPDQRDKRLARQNIRLKKLMENETSEERAKRHFQRLERLKLLRADMTKWERLLARETPEQRERRVLRYKERRRNKKANETPAEREKRRARGREGYRKYYQENREARIEISREKRANETPEQREKRLACKKVSRLRAKERRAKLQAEKVKKVKRKAREIASKRIINNGKRKRERDAIDISKILQRRAVVVLQRLNVPSSFEVSNINAENHGENRLSLEQHEENFVSAEILRKNREVTQVPGESRVRANGRNLRPVSAIETPKRFAECYSSDSDRRKAEAVERMRTQIARETPEELARCLTTETFAFRHLIEKYFPVSDEECRIDIADETIEKIENRLEISSAVNSDEKLEASQEVEARERLALTESIRNDHFFYTKERVTPVEESENISPDKDFVLKIGEKLETPEELETRLAAERLAFRKSIKKYSGFFTQDSAMRAEESAKDLTAGNLDARIDDELETAVTHRIEECEQNLAARNLVVISDDELESCISQSNEEGEKDLTGRNLDVRIDDETEMSVTQAEESEKDFAVDNLDVPVRIGDDLEELEACRAANKVSQLTGKFTANEQKKGFMYEMFEELLRRNEETAEEREARVMAEIVAFRMWREKNPRTRLSSYVTKYLAKRNGIVNVATTWSAIEREWGRKERERLELVKCGLLSEPGERTENEERNRVRAKAEYQRKRKANETPDQRAKRLAALRQWKKRNREKETPEERAKRRQMDTLATRRRRAAKKAAALQTQQDQSNEPPNATGEDATICSDSRDANDKAVAELLHSKSLDNADGETNDQFDAETLSENTGSNSFAAAEARNEDRVYSFSECLGSGDTAKRAETLANWNSDDVVRKDQVDSNGFVMTDVEAFSSSSNFSTVLNEDGVEKRVNLSSNLATGENVIYALANASGPSEEERATGTVPNTFYVTNEDGTSSEIVFVYIDGVAI